MTNQKKPVYPDASRGRLTSGVAQKQFAKAKGKDKKFHFGWWLIALLVFVLSMLWIMGLEDLV